MKSAVETLGPTRVRLAIEVPFDELSPAVDSAYRKLAQQVRVRGFRPGKVPPRIVDQHVGRGTVLTEALDEAVPQLYGQAVRENELSVLGHPELEITEFADGAELKFTAEVDVRPQLELPDYEGLPVTVGDAGPSDEEVEEQLAGLRERFATLTGVSRAVRQGDYVLLDIAGTLDGEAVDDASATGMSYEVGSGGLVEGLDDAITGANEGDERTFTTALRGGAYAGRDMELTVRVRSVKEKELPALDDDFAQTASEFDTIDELRADIRTRLERVKRLQQGLEARDKVLEAYLTKVKVPLPERVLDEEVEWRLRNLDQQLEQAALTREEYASSENKSVEDLEREVREGAEQALRAQFVLDALALKEQLQVTEADLTEQIVARAQRAQVPPQQLAQRLVESGQLPALAGEVLRAKALALLLEHAKITDESGNEVDLGAFDPAVIAEDAAAAREADEYDEAYEDEDEE